MMMMLERNLYIRLLTARVLPLLYGPLDFQGIQSMCRGHVDNLVILIGEFSDKGLRKDIRFLKFISTFAWFPCRDKNSNGIVEGQGRDGLLGLARFHARH